MHCWGLGGKTITRTFIELDFHFAYGDFSGNVSITFSLYCVMIDHLMKTPISHPPYFAP